MEDKSISNSMRFRSQKKQGLDIINPLDELTSSPVKSEALKAINEASEDQIKALAAARLKERN